MIKKKRKIKVPAASFGLFGGQNSRDMERAAQTGLQKDMPELTMAGLNVPTAIDNGTAPVPTNADRQPVRPRRPKGINSNVMSTVGTIAEALPGAVSMLTSIGSESTATTGADAAKQSVQDIMGGAATGMQLGSALGPMGAMAGAAIGAGVGLIGKSGREAEMTSFTDYDEGTLGTGLIGAFGNKRLRRERARIKQNAYANRAAVQGTGQLQADYNLEHGQMDANTFAYGGMPTSLAYVDDGELISTPDGTVSKVPELGRPTDSNLVQLPGGSKILSDKLKVPGTKKTFAQVGEEMMATKKSKFNDIYAQNAAKLNEMNNKSIHDQLFEMQEAVKAKKGIKRKYKNAVVAAEDGDIVIPYTRQPSYSKRYQLRQDGTLNFTARPDETVSVGNVVMYGNTPYRTTSKYTTGNARNSQQLATPIEGDFTQPTKVDMGNWGLDQYLPDIVVTPKKEVTVTPTPYAATVTPRPAVVSKPKRKNTFELSPSDWIGENDVTYNIDPDGWRREWTSEDLPLTETTITTTTAPKQRDKDPDINPIDWTGIASGIAGLAPILSNLNTRPEYQNTIYNPFANATMTTMRNRRYDISPAIRDIERNRAIANYNESQMNTNTGANMAFRLQNASNTAKAIANIRSQESNVNNQYLADYADTLNDLGRQWANESIRVQDANMANRAQARNIRRAGLSGLSQWFQNRELMRNQRNRDNMMMALYDPFLEAGFTTGDLTNFRNWLRRTNG